MSKGVNPGASISHGGSSSSEISGFAVARGSLNGRRKSAKVLAATLQLANAGLHFLRDRVEASKL